MRILTIFLLFILSFFMNGCNNQQNNKIELYKVQNTPDTIYTGTVKFEHTSNLSFQENGVLIYAPFATGDFVKKGDIVAKIDDTLYKIKLNEEIAYLSELQTKYKQAQSYYNRINILHSSGAISDNEWETAGYDTALKSKEIALQKEKINYIKKELNYTTLYSAFDGFVLEKKGEVGEYANAGKTIISILNSKNTQVEIMVSADSVNKLNINDEVYLKYNNKNYKGKITHISQSSNISGGYLIKISLDKFYFELKEGMNMDVIIPKLNATSVFIPLKAIIKENNSSFVYKLENINNNTAKAKKTKVITGSIKGENQEILSGLKKDDFIILKGKNNVKNNDKIKL